MARTTPLYILCLLLGAATLSAYELFVSPAGNDAWSGLIAEPNSDSSDGPFETLTKAQNTLRQMKTQNSLPTETVYVTIREGNYRLQHTWSFGDGLFKRIFPGAELRGKSGQVTVQLDGVKPGSRQVRAVVKTDNAHGQSSAVTVRVVPPPAGDKTPSERPAWRSFRADVSRVWVPLWPS